jgi:ketosteroid isomerase-like protein
MKKMIFLFVFFAAYTLTSHAQSANESAVAEAVAKLNKAILDEDTNALKQLTAKELSFGHSSGKVENQQEFVTNVSQGAIHFKTLDISDQTIALAADNAIVRNSLHGNVLRDGKPDEIKLKILMVWHKDKKGKWKLLARQAVKTT